MKSDDLERLEESQEMQQLIRSAKEQYEQEKSAQPRFLILSLHGLLKKGRKAKRWK